MNCKTFSELIWLMYQLNGISTVSHPTYAASDSTWHDKTSTLPLKSAHLLSVYTAMFIHYNRNTIGCHVTHMQLNFWGGFRLWISIRPQRSEFSTVSPTVRPWFIVHLSLNVTQVYLVEAEWVSAFCSWAEGVF